MNFGYIPGGPPGGPPPRQVEIVDTIPANGGTFTLKLIPSKEYKLVGWVGWELLTDKNCFPISLDQDVAGGDFIKMRFLNIDNVDVKVRLIGLEIKVE